jgi:hypothetical protein
MKDIKYLYIMSLQNLPLSSSPNLSLSSLPGERLIDSALASLLPVDYSRDDRRQSSHGYGLMNNRRNISIYGPYNTGLCKNAKLKCSDASRPQEADYRLSHPLSLSRQIDDSYRLTNDYV